ncbi:MAG: hypothetical protein ISS88_02510 [Candidatus Portnoybacteria bacterium]|nr:hypothetical protein [Candidatus Portnoybacteria bacterium]
MTAYIKSKKFSKPNHHQGLAILSMLIIFSLFCLGFFYLIQINSLVEGSYQIRQQKEYLHELEVKSQQLEMSIANWQSPANLEELIQSLNMVEGSQAIYLEEDKAVAIKE